jgi:WD40 repeat protein
MHEEAVVEKPDHASLGKDVIKSHNHMAWVEKQGDQRLVRLDGKQQGRTYQEVKDLQFSEDGAHLAFIGRREQILSLIYDGKEVPEPFSWISIIAWQPRGTSYAYTACQEKKCHLYVNGEATGAEYQSLSLPKYSKDGAHLAYMGWRRKGNWITVLDGKETGPGMESFEGNSDRWGFSDHGNHFYVAAGRGFRTQGYQTYYLHWTYIVDGVAGPEFEVISPIDFSRDGAHYAYAGTVVKLGWKEKPQSSVVVDGQTKTTYDGQKFFGQLRTGVHDFHPHFHGLSDPVFEPDGKLVYAARRDGGNVVVFVGNEAGPGYTDIISPLIFSPDGQHFAYVAQQGESLVEVHDNHPGITFPIESRRECYAPWIYVTNEPSHHLVYELACGRTKFVRGFTSRALRRIVVDGKSGPEYDAYGLYGFRYTEDWKHYGYEVHGMNGNHVLLNVDGKETKIYDDVVTGSLDFPVGSETASFIAREGGTLVRVKWPLESPKPPESQRSQ